MNLKSKIIDFIKKIKKKYSDLEFKQKILVLAVGLIILIIIVKLFSMNTDKIVDYKKFDVSLEYVMMDKVTDNNLYVTLVSISKDFLNKTLQYEGSKKIDIGEVYNSTLSEEYRDFLSRNKFNKLYKLVIEKSNKVKEKNMDFIPENIVTDGNGRYIIKYSCEEENIYIGIQLNTAYNKYYIWYLE